MEKQSNDWSVTDQKFAEITDLRFVSKIFHPCPSLRSKKPDKGWSMTKPYRGGGYDGSAFVLIEGGWDHEHCSFCSLRIADGDTYWVNTGEVILLCPACFEHYRDRMPRK